MNSGRERGVSDSESFLNRERPEDVRIAYIQTAARVERIGYHVRTPQRACKAHSALNLMASFCPVAHLVAHSLVSQENEDEPDLAVRRISVRRQDEVLSILS